MPIYEFECLGCKKRFEKLCSISASLDGVSCPECEGSEVKRLMSAFFSGGSSGGSSCSCGGSCGGNCGNCSGGCGGCHH